MDIKKTFTRDLNYRFVNQAIDMSLFAGLRESAGAPSKAVVMFEGRGVRILRLTLPALKGDAEKACIRALRKQYADAVYLFADRAEDTDATSYHLCNDAGKQLALTPEKKLLFTEKVKFFEVSDEVTGTLDLKERIERAFESEKVTKRFYADFQKYRDLLLKFIKGIDLDEDKNWYASVLLNRLMFIYFVQKRGFIGGRMDWLRERLAEHEQTKRNFYAEFLLPLFFEGFAQPKGQRGAREFAFADVPYLNGGLFLPHTIEDKYGAPGRAGAGGITIDNKVLRELLDYFNGYHWYLDDRELRNENEINPDVLGYIFEKYVNQKQMGAYYTKEDITGYICKNTIVPFALDKLTRLHAEAAGAISADAPARLPLAITDENIERYIYYAVKTEAFLPTETEREYAARRKRFEEIKRAAADGRIAAVNDLITWNLDIITYADDAVANMDAHALRLFYFQCLKPMTILDPTCGSGAFLFAALNILLPLYLTALRRMRGFADEYARKVPPGHSNEAVAFREQLGRIGQHGDATQNAERYFIVKTIIVNNLYGVDIMEEAVEICKLRLFLRLAAEISAPDPQAGSATREIEPLPDIDFNIKAGNTLVGFATRDEVKRALTTEVQGGVVKEKLVFGETVDALADIERACELADQAYRRFHRLQTEMGITAAALATAKAELKSDLRGLNETLHRALAREYGVAVPDGKAKNNAKAQKLAADAYTKWLASHQPFHWFAEFYGILREGGFDVVVGNPPYVNASKVLANYAVINYVTSSCPDIYAWVLERSELLLNEAGWAGMIVPLSVGFSADFAAVRDLLRTRYESNWFSSFGRIPSALFSFDVRVRNTIHLGHKTGGRSDSVYSSRLHRWFETARPYLFESLEYAKVSPDLWHGRIPKIGSQILCSAFESLLGPGRKSAGSSLSGIETKHVLHFKKTAYNWLCFCRTLPPCYDGTKLVEHTKFGAVYFANPAERNLSMVLLNGKLQFTFWCAIGDDFDVTRWNFTEFPVDVTGLPVSVTSRLLVISPLLEKAMVDATQFKLNAGRRVGNYNLAKCRQITDNSDRILLEHFGLSEVWEEIETYCAQVVRTDYGIAAESDE